ncbi:hypothetical protein COB72_06510 [bacterium]|nr:MAG: hypothetical protein COB72_06510 [bacterium]
MEEVGDILLSTIFGVQSGDPLGDELGRCDLICSMIAFFNNDKVWLLVSYEGIGMTREVYKNELYTTKPREQRTGLVLAVAAGIVREMGANIEVASIIGVGTMIDSHLKVHF